MTRARTRRAAGWAAGLAAATALAACAPLQVVPLRVDPAGAEIFLDGRPLPAGVEHVELRADRDHTFFVKSQGYRSELIVLRAGERGGASGLAPATVDVRLERLVPRGAEIRIESAPE